MDTVKIFMIALFLSVGLLVAQEASPSPAPTRRGVWRAELPGGTYIVRLNAITSLSVHEYVVDNSARVSEVNIGTTGSELVRFYFIEPNVPKMPDGIGQSSANVIEDRVKEMASRANLDDVWTKVSKNYPTTTHAKTVEYRISSKEVLTKLFKHAENAWLTGDGGTFKP